jgi:2-iminobutanoate/2-iminopropanoate deaminase
VNDKIITIGKRNPNLPFHPGVRAGDFIYVSGQVAKDENGNMCSGNIEEETRWTIESMRRILLLDGADSGATIRSSPNTSLRAVLHELRSRLVR